MFELFGTTAPIVTEEILVNKIRTADWKYEFSEDENRQERGRKAMALLEKQVYAFYKKDPARAVFLWNEFAPCGALNKTVVPEFIIRNELFDSAIG